MRVGVLTFHLVINHGAYLQAFCLVETIRQLGHEAEIINYVNKDHWNSTRFKPWVYRRPARLWHDFKAHLAFRRAIARLPLTPFTTDPKEVDWNRYDSIVIGSDIVWNLEDPRLGKDPVYFGIVPTGYKGRFVAYAPSIGGMQWDVQVPEWVHEGLQRFHAIGVRDENTQQFVKRHAGYMPQLVADPTWLTDADLRQIVPASRKEAEEFFLVYAFSIDDTIANAIRTFANEHGLATVAVGYWQKWCDKNWSHLDPFQWAHAFKQAKCVVTRTLHGTLYSIKQGAQFCVLSHPAIDAKVATPLVKLGLQERLVSDPKTIAPLLLKPINYAEVHRKRAAFGSESLEFLKQALA